MWESWGAIGKAGTVSAYSYNHYAFGCIGEWMYRELGGLKAKEPGYKKILIEPGFYCGLDMVTVREKTPYGEASVQWEREGENVQIHVMIPANTTAEVVLSGIEPFEIGSGKYIYYSKLTKR